MTLRLFGSRPKSLRLPPPPLVRVKNLHFFPPSDDDHDFWDIVVVRDTGPQVERVEVSPQPLTLDDERRIGSLVLNELALFALLHKLYGSNEHAKNAITASLIHEINASRGFDDPKAAAALPELFAQIPPHHTVFAKKVNLDRIRYEFL